jgi:hypothetical protein
MEDVRIREVAHNTGNMLKDLEFLVNIECREFGIACLGVGIAESSI